LNLHNDSVQALRFPHDSHKKELEKSAKLLEEERALEQEILEKGLDDDDAMDF
jgi:26S proteasome regulatory subunit N3